MSWTDLPGRTHAIVRDVAHGSGESINVWFCRDVGGYWRCQHLVNSQSRRELSLQSDREPNEKEPAEATARIANAWIAELRGIKE